MTKIDEAIEAVRSIRVRLGPIPDPYCDRLEREVFEKIIRDLEALRDREAVRP